MEGLIGGAPARASTALLCHGPVAMLAALPQAAAYRKALVAGDAAAARAAALGWPYAGYRMTNSSNDEELVAQEKFLHGELPFFVADTLRGAGGRVENGPKFQPFGCATASSSPGRTHPRTRPSPTPSFARSTRPTAPSERRRSP